MAQGEGGRKSWSLASPPAGCWGIFSAVWSLGRTLCTTYHLQGLPIHQPCSFLAIQRPLLHSHQSQRAGVLTLMQDDVTGISSHLWFGHADARRFVTALKPRLQAAAADTQRLLSEVIGLQVRVCVVVGA